MKTIYIKPEIDIVKLNLINSVLEDVGVNQDSKQGKWGDAGAKKNTQFEEDEPNDEVSQSNNLWDE